VTIGELATEARALLGEIEGRDRQRPARVAGLVREGA